VGRVRNRIQAAEAEISDDVLDEFIADEQAFVESYAGKTFADTDPQLGLARSICTSQSHEQARSAGKLAEPTEMSADLLNVSSVHR